LQQKKKEKKPITSGDRTGTQQNLSNLYYLDVYGIYQMTHPSGGVFTTTFFFVT
jgi:hypothetical protein